MQKINLLFLTLIAGSMQAVTINITNNSSKPITAELYEAVEKQSTLGEPEFEGWAAKINPGDTGVIKANLSADKYELNAHDSGTSVFKTSRGRKLDILVGTNNDVFHVVVHENDIEWAKSTPAGRGHRYGRRNTNVW